jgi:hypothetical protein
MCRGLRGAKKSASYKRVRAIGESWGSNQTWANFPTVSDKGKNQIKYALVFLARHVYIHTYNAWCACTSI